MVKFLPILARRPPVRAMQSIPTPSVAGHLRFRLSLVKRSKITETGLSHAFSIRHYRDLSIVYRVTLQYGKRWGVADCEQHYYESKVMLGIKCLSSVADQVHKNQKEKSDFTLLIQEIMKDPEFWQAYDKCREYIGIKANVVCWLLRHHKVKSVCICFCI